MLLPAKILYELLGYLIDHNCVFSVVSQKDTMLTANGSVFADAMACIPGSSMIECVHPIFYQ